VLDPQGKPVTEAMKTTTQTLAMGPVASQEAIKMLGTNGGGFFNANSAHPYENPTPLSNFIQMLAIFLIPAALCFTFGEMVRDRRQGVAVLASMTVIFIVMAVAAMASEQHITAALSSCRSTMPRPRCRQAATWKARKCASAYRPLRCSPRSRPPLRAARSTPCTTRSRPSAVWCRCC
jgi:hypothetical protein